MGFYAWLILNSLEISLTTKRLMSLELLSLECGSGNAVLLM
jgi:hypothetical protein